VDKFIFADLGIILISGCTLSQADKEQNAALHLINPPQQSFQQWKASKTHPVEYFTCGELSTLCRYSLTQSKGDRHA